ncbi:hypothetical protein BDF22DRAFT_742662 [Syncephalis plumigaleata]|nr:hypothetical protein BDF22DRAFT_742662 [Syncephalis plumigaleata]
MLVPNTSSPDVVCDPYMNIYNCYGSKESFYSIFFCLLVTLVATVYGLCVSTTRWRHGIGMKLLHCVEGYWLPTYIDSVIMTCYLCNAYRMFHYICMLADWPRHWVWRGLLTGIFIFTVHIPVIIMIVGIISYIPSIFIRRSIFKQNDNAIGRLQRNTLYVPSAKQLFWISILLASSYLLCLLANSLSLGWIRARGMASIDDPVHRVLGSYAAIYSTILFVMALYYAHGFNIILCNHIHRTSLNGSLKSEEINAGFRFRRIFIILIVATVSCVFFSILTTAFLLSLWPTIVLFVGGHALTYQTILIGVFYTQSQNTKAYIRRLTLSEETNYRHHDNNDNNNAWHTITNNAYLEFDKSHEEYSPPCHSFVMSFVPSAKGPLRFSKSSGKASPYLNHLSISNNEDINSYGLQSTRIGIDRFDGGGDDYMGVSRRKERSRWNNEAHIDAEPRRPPPSVQSVQTRPSSM